MDHLFKWLAGTTWTNLEQKMSSKGESSSSTAERKVKKEAASVIPVKRKLVKTMAVEAIISAFSPSGSSRTSDHSNGNGRGRATEGAFSGWGGIRR
ncbi:hypothetical protein Bca4012_071257 [Brassica carinata]